MPAPYSRRAGRGGFFLTLALLATACGPGHVRVTGKDAQDPTWLGTQSETASDTSFYKGQGWFIVTYNDDTDDGRIKYTADDRIVYPGASMLGWSYSSDRGKTWTYGGKVKPPKGIAALWGDPAIVTSRTQYNRVYISSLAIDESKIPPEGHHGWMDDGSITGACVARSDDGGMHFAIQSCFSAGGDFYDGSSLAAAAAGDGRIFAAYNDVPKSRIDVWASADGVAPFQQLPDPFPGMFVASHPRLAYDPINGGLLVAAIAIVNGNGFVYMNRLTGNTWGAPVQASNASTRTDVKVGTQTIRIGSSFSFDVGAPSETELDDGSVRVNDDAVRLLYTARDADTKRLYVRGSSCRHDLSKCRDVPQWGTTPGNLNTPRDQFNPTVKAWRGFLTLTPEWKATYQTTDDDPNAVSIKQGNLVRFADGTPVFLPFNLISARPVCPDYRYGSPGNAKSGYWGDYDNMAMAGFSDGNTYPDFLLAFSDSSQGCISQSMFTSNHLHVGSVVFP